MFVDTPKPQVPPSSSLWVRNFSSQHHGSESSNDRRKVSETVFEEQFHAGKLRVRNFMVPCHHNRLRAKACPKPDLR